MKRSLVFALLAAPLLLTAPACRTVNYSGATEYELPSSAYVAVYHAPSEIRGQWRVLGTGTFRAPEGMTRAAILRTFRDAARKHGANGILITEMRRVPDGMARLDQVENENVPSIWPVDDSASAQQYMASLFSAGPDPEVALYDTFVRADFLVISPYPLP